MYRSIIKLLFVVESAVMGRKRKSTESPVQNAAKKVRARYSHKSPVKADRVRRALYAVEIKKVPLRKPAVTQ